MKIIVVGGGFAGCAAAVQAAKMGAEVSLIERTDMLCGTGAVGGIFRNNGRYTAAEEMIAMGGGEVFKVLDEYARHKNISFPGHEHASLFDVAKVPVVMERLLESFGVTLYKCTRISAVHMQENYTIKEIVSDDGTVFGGDVFIDATGTAGPLNMCYKNGRGCASCVLRCSTFGGRISLSALCGVREYAVKGDGERFGAMSGSCKLMKESLSGDIQKVLNKKGVAVIPVPKHLQEDHRSMKACQQYTAREYAENIILLDTGHAKMMTPFFSLEKLHKIPGFEYARYEDPYAGGVGNSIRFTAMVKRENNMKVKGMSNLFCAGEKSGAFVGHTEAIVTGVLAGYNAVKNALDLESELLVLPVETACGFGIDFAKEKREKCTFSGTHLLELLKEKRLYTTDTNVIYKRVKDCGLENVFNVLQS